MGSRRDVDSLVAVFDLKFSSLLNLPNNASARVIFVYDKKKQIKSFKFVDTKIPRSIVCRLTSWLDQNVDIDDIAFGLESNNLDMESFAKATTVSQ